MEYRIGIDRLLDGYEYVVQGTNYDRFKVKTIQLNFVQEDIEAFNKLYIYCHESDMHIIQRTPKGSIRKGPKMHLYNGYAYDIVATRARIKLTIIECGKIYVFNLGHKDKSTNGDITPLTAWNTFVKACEANNIDISAYRVPYEDGLKYKEQIEKPLIEMNVLDKELDNVHHLDYHNSFPGGLCNTHPEFRPVIEPIYADRKVKPENKAVLNYTIGCMQSTQYPWFAGWAYLSRDAIRDNNDRIKSLAVSLLVSGRKIIGFNTDGIWYQGEIYHGPGEGKNIGEWENDHVNCKFRAKSNGIYEYIENGEYHPVVRGTSTLDMIEPDRSKWKWGDIYKQAIITYKFDIEKGVIQNNE